MALFKIRRFLESGLRLRSACDLEVREVRVTRPAGFALPGTKDLEEALPGLIATVFQDVPEDKRVTVLRWSGAAKKAKKAKDAEAAGE